MHGERALLPRRDKIERLEVSSLAQTSSAVASSTDGSINADSVDGTPDPQRTKVAITHLSSCSSSPALVQAWQHHGEARVGCAAQHVLAPEHCSALLG